jgi:hypothetical protein
MQSMSSALISASTALVTALLVVLVSDYLKRKSEERQERGRVSLKYLNPLRLYLAENYIRLSQITGTISKQRRCEPLLFVSEAEAVSDQEPEWFNAEGCYLISSCYFAACLLYHLRKLGEDFPYLGLKPNEDTRLLDLMFEVSAGFLQNLGIYYAIQPSIGIDMYLPDRDRLMTYREFCEVLRNPEKRKWFDRLLNFYIDSGQGTSLDRALNVVDAMRNLAALLDKVVGSAAYAERYKVENVPAPKI